MSNALSLLKLFYELKGNDMVLKSLRPTAAKFEPHYIAAIKHMIRQSKLPIHVTGESIPGGLEDLAKNTSLLPTTRLTADSARIKALLDVPNVKPYDKGWFSPSVMTLDDTRRNLDYGDLNWAKTIRALPDAVYVQTSPYVGRNYAAAMHEMGHGITHQRKPKLNAEVAYNYPEQEFQLGSDMGAFGKALPPGRMGSMASLAGDFLPGLSGLQDEFLASYQGYKALKAVQAPASVKFDYLKNTIPPYFSYVSARVPFI